MRKSFKLSLVPVLALLGGCAITAGSGPEDVQGYESKFTDRAYKTGDKATEEVCDPEHVNFDEDACDSALARAEKRMKRGNNIDLLKKNNIASVNQAELTARHATAQANTVTAKNRAFHDGVRLATGVVGAASNVHFQLETIQNDKKFAQAAQTTAQAAVIKAENGPDQQIIDVDVENGNDIDVTNNDDDVITNQQEQGQGQEQGQSNDNDLSVDVETQLTQQEIELRALGVCINQQTGMPFVCGGD